MELLLSPVEESRFGFSCARADGVTANDLERIEAFCRSNRVRMLTARCDVADIATAQALEASVARLMASFVDDFSQDRADPRWPREQVDASYIEWAQTSCTGAADHVNAAELDRHIVGFATLRKNSPKESEGVLFGVHPNAQGKGVYRGFMIAGMEWCRDNDMSRMVVSTQVDNDTVQRAWSRLGFLHFKSFYTFHRRFD